MANPNQAFGRSDQLILFDQGRRLASLIPGARFVPVESDNHVPFAEEACWPTIAQELRSFLGEESAAAAPPALTRRQTEVLRMVSQGKTDKQIAKELALSPRTVEMHVAGALTRLQCTTRSEAVYVATTHHMLTSTVALP